MNKVECIGDGYKYIRLPFYTEAFALMIIPFEELLALPIGSVLRFVNLLSIFVCLFYTKKIYLGNRYFGRAIHFLLIFLGYAVISGIWCINRTFYIDRLFTYSMYVVLILFLHTLKPNEAERKLLLKGIYLGGIISTILLWVNNGAAIDIGLRETIVVFGRMVDPNILAYSCVISFIINLYYIMFEKGKYRINYKVLPIPFLFYSILILGSRGALFTCVVVSAYMVFKVEFVGNRILKKVLFIFLVLIACFLFYTEFILTSEFGERFTIDNLIGQGELGTANRDRIWSAALEQIFNRPFFGYGNGASMYAIEMVYKYYGTHNSYIMILLEFGIVGFVLCGAWIIREWQLCKQNQIRIYAFLFLSLLIFVFFVEGFSTKIFWGVQILLMTSYEFDKKDKDGESEDGCRQ